VFSAVLSNPVTQSARVDTQVARYLGDRLTRLTDDAELIDNLIAAQQEVRRLNGPLGERRHVTEPRQPLQHAPGALTVRTRTLKARAEAAFPEQRRQHVEDAHVRAARLATRPA
jgi:hypothetical protein